jgi:acetyl esterase/lipase
MPKTVLQGRFTHKIRGLSNLLGVSCQVLARRAVGKPLVQEWPAIFEMATLFWRAQFNHAFSLPNINEARAYFDSVISLPDTLPAVDVIPSSPGEPAGAWYIPRCSKGEATVLYFHGGGYTYYAEVSRLFIALLADWLGLRIFAPDYRLTPEHPHPAQQEDGLAAYRFLLTRGIAPEKLVVCGDSAGGHLTLMTLIRLRETGLAQPALAIALSPWTDTGLRGASQFGNDVYDMVQGYMTLQFSEWLKGGQAYDDHALSPIYQDLRGLAPIYLQAGGKEILVDMIRDFSRTVAEQDGRVRLDVWEHMTHEFHAYGELIPESAQALDQMRLAIDWATQGLSPADLPRLNQTEVDTLTVYPR